jgi:hypothetical protein
MTATHRGPTRRRPDAELPQRRQQLILARIHQTGAAYISELIRQFGISAATARRDLDSLAERGSAQRVHGGAILANPTTSPPSRNEPMIAGPSRPIKFLIPKASGMRNAATTDEVLDPPPLACDAEEHLQAAQRLAIRAEDLLLRNDSQLAQACCQLADLHLRLALVRAPRYS